MNNSHQNNTYNILFEPKIGFGLILNTQYYRSYLKMFFVDSI